MLAIGTATAVEVVRLSTRFRWGAADVALLLRKSINLALCYSGIVKPDHGSILGTARAATFCAAYDLVTDHHSFNPDEIRLFLERTEALCGRRCRELAAYLVLGEVENRLAEDGLERGPIALEFLLILARVNWSRAHVYRLGRLFQMLDDALDYFDDRLSGDENCFFSHRASSYAGELRAALTVGGLLSRLVEQSRVLQVVRVRAERNLIEIEKMGWPNRPAAADALAVSKREVQSVVYEDRVR